MICLSLDLGSNNVDVVPSDFKSCINLSAISFEVIAETCTDQVLLGCVISGGRAVESSLVGPCAPEPAAIVSSRLAGLVLASSDACVAGTLCCLFELVFVPFACFGFP